MPTNKNGKIYLVGAGPGAPDLITLKGIECIAAADFIIYDYLASTTLLRYASEKAESIFVGKQGGNHTMPQDAINALMIAKAQTGSVVTRLKGGDPFIFGRGGEEVEELVQAKIPFEIVPGVTSAIAAPTYAGIPLTHRDYTSSLAFITGHEDPGRNESRLDWAAIAKMGTLVFLMGVKNLPKIVKQLIQAGKEPQTPAALVQWGTLPQQTTISGTLENIVAKKTAANLTPPAVLVVGSVVSLREKMQWFKADQPGALPLAGQTIVVTRARQQASELVTQLSVLGAECLEVPTIKVVPAEDLGPLKSAITNLSLYEWLVFTSVNGVDFFFKHLFASGKDVRSLHHIRTASIGPATAARLFAFGIRSDIIPLHYHAESVVAAFEKINIQGVRILLPRAKEARPILPQELTGMGAQVDEVTAYQTCMVATNSTTLIQKLKTNKINMVTFTSSSTVKNFKKLLPDDFNALMRGVIVACIGPITAATANQLGFKVDLVASEHTIAGLCHAIKERKENL